MSPIKIVYLLQFIWSAGFNLVSRILPSYFATIASASQIGIIYSIYSGAKFFNIPSGWFADKIGKARTLFLTFFILPFIVILFTISESIYFFALMFFIIGLLGNFYYSSSISIITILHKKNTESLFKLESMYQLGVVIGPITGGILTLRYGIETAFYTWAGLGIMGFILSFFLLKKEKSIQAESKKPNLKQLSSQLGSKKSDFLVFLIIGGFLTGLFEAIIGLSLPLYASELGFDISQVGIIIGAAALLSIIGLLFLGKKLENIKKEYSLFLTTFLIGFSILALAVIQSMLGIILLVTIFTIGRAGGLNIARSFVSENMDENIRATGMAINDNIQHAGRMIGPLLAGFLIDFTNIQACFLATAGISILGIIFLIGYKIKKDGRKNQGIIKNC